MKNFAYRDAESAKRPNDLNQAIQSTTVVATNEWKYHADLQLQLDENLPLSALQCRRDQSSSFKS